MSGTSLSGALPSGGGAPAGRLLRSSGVMAAGTLASRVLGFVRSLVLVSVIGTYTIGDAFGLANAIPNILFTLVAGGVLNAVFVPLLVRAMTSGEQDGKAYADRLLTLSMVVLVGVTVVATLAAPVIVDVYAGDRMSATDVALATAFAYWCLPQVFFYGLYTMLGQVLNARGSFGPMMWTPILNNVVGIVTGAIFWLSATIVPRDSSSLSAGEIAVLGAGTTLGIVVQALALVPVLRRTGYRFRPRFDWRRVGLGRAGSLAKWTLGFVAVNQLAYLVVVRLTTSAGKQLVTAEGIGGGYFSYQNAYLVFLLPHSLITVSIVTALLPRMSAAAVAGRLDRVRADISQGVRLAGVATVPAAAIFVALGPEIGGTLFGVGRNGVASGLYMGAVLSAFALGLVPFSAHHLVLRGFYAQEDTRTPFLFACVIAATNALLAWVAFRTAPVQGKTVAIAGAYAVSAAVGFVVSASVLRSRLGGIDGRRVLRTYVRLVLAAIIGAVPGWAVARGVRTVLPPDQWPVIVLALGLGTVVTLAGYVAAASRMHVRELTAMLTTVRSRFGS